MTRSTRVKSLQSRMTDAGIDLAIISDPDAICYFADYWNYLGTEFGRPTLLIVSRDREPTLITPLMESEMCRRMTWITDVRPWADGVDSEWRGELEKLLVKSVSLIGIEKRLIPASIAVDLYGMLGSRKTYDIGPIIGNLRTIKTVDEIIAMKDAGKVAVAMVEGARASISEGVPEYEIALAVIAAGTRKAASLLDLDRDRFTSPTIYNLQIIQSGMDTCMVHRRSSVKLIERGDPIYLCFCGIANFRNFKLGFDREFFVGTVTDEQARVYETTVRAQRAALSTIRPGARCEEVNAAAESVYREAGLSPGYRTGRSIGYSFLEAPELKRGDKTVIEAGMTFAVDGGITIEGKFGGRIGDSIVVTDGGFDFLTPYPRELTVL